MPVRQLSLRPVSWDLGGRSRPNPLVLRKQVDDQHGLDVKCMKANLEDAAAERGTRTGIELAFKNKFGSLGCSENSTSNFMHTDFRAASSNGSTS